MPIKEQCIHLQQAWTDKRGWTGASPHGTGVLLPPAQRWLHSQHRAAAARLGAVPGIHGCPRVSLTGAKTLLLVLAAQGRAVAQGGHAGGLLHGCRGWGFWIPQLIHTRKKNTSHKHPRNKQKTAEQLEKHQFLLPREKARWGLGAELLSGEAPWTVFWGSVWWYLIRLAFGGWRQFACFLCISRTAQKKCLFF